MNKECSYNLAKLVSLLRIRRILFIGSNTLKSFLKSLIKVIQIHSRC